MGKRLPTTASLEIYARAAAARLPLKSKKPSNLNPHPHPNLNPSFKSKSVVSLPPTSTAAARRINGGMEAPATGEERVPLSEVVSDCVRRWFQDTLKEARAGDTSMQVLVAQMYQTGYGVPKNEQKARVWIEKASKYRSSVWKVRNKRPGYNASDSDSDEVEENAKQ
ncbi:hypothetical protein LUZ60_013104 [Juncus effusus]|nr:hypothetical protein LUZ60_013104 [Juncus effusus]